MRVYIDTNIWLDYFFHRTQGMLSPAETAHSIFKRSVSCEFYIIFSDILLAEIEKHIPKESLHELLERLRPKIILVKPTSEDVKRARKLTIHFPDNLHLHLAKKHHAKLVSNDKELIDQGAIPSHIL